ncbi:MAG: GAF domain-containing protein, partial [Solirubrobacteraceae bacterium]
MLGAAVATVFRFDPEWITLLGHHGSAPLPPRLSREEPSTVADVARTGKLLRHDHFQAVSGSVAALVREKDGVHSTIGVPVFLGGTLWGAVTAGTASAAGFPDETEQALVRLAELVSSSLANAQAQERLRFRARFEEALRQVAISAGSGQLSDRELCQLVAEQLSELLDASGTGVVRFEGDAMIMLGASGPAAPLVGRPVDPRSVVGELARTGTTVVSEDYSHFGGAYDSLARDCGAQSAVAVPVRVGGELWGCLSAMAASSWFATDVVELVERFAQILSVALANALAERELLESKRKLEAALSSMTDAVFISDEQGRFIHFNEAFTTFHRFQSREQTLRSLEDYPAILEVFMADGSPAALEQWAVPRALRGEVGVAVEYGLRRKDTGERWVGIYNFAPIRSAEGAIVGSVVTGRDITEQKRAEAERKRTHDELEEAQRLARLSAWTWEPNAQRATWSAHVFALFGRDPARGPATGEELLAYVNPEHRERVAARFGLAGPVGGEFEFEFAITTDAGEERVLYAIGRPDPACSGCYRGTFQDVSDQRRAEVAEAANRAKSEFLSRMSHELRTPLNAISGFGQLLAMDDLEPSQAESVDFVLKGAELMLALVDEVLDLSRVEAGKLRVSPEAVVVADTVAEAAALVAPLADASGVTIETD